MRIVVILALLALVWADSPPQTLSTVGSTGSQPSPNISTKEKEKRTTAKVNITPGIKYAHQQAPSLPAQVHAQYIPQQQQQQQQQLLQQQQQQQVYSTIPHNYLQQTYQPQYNLQYLTPQTQIPQQQAYIAPQQQQVRYQFVPKGQAAEVASNQIAATQQQQQYILPQQQQALAFSQPQTYLLPQAQPQQYFSGGFGGYFLPGQQQQVQPIIMLAIPAQQYDAGLLGLYQGGAGAHQGRSLQLLGGGSGVGYQQQYLIPQHQQQLVQQQLTYLLNQQQPQQQQQQQAAATHPTAQNPHYSQRSAAGQASAGTVQLRQQQQYKS